MALPLEGALSPSNSPQADRCSGAQGTRAQRAIEGEAPQALPVEGATLAPVIAGKLNRCIRTQGRERSEPLRGRLRRLCLWRGRR